MPSIELVFEASCPFVGAARRNLAAALRQAGLPENWTEWETGDDATPARVRLYGSPTILIDGRDVAGVPASEASHCCRIYSPDADERGAPPVQMIAAVLSRMSSRVRNRSLLSGGGAMLPTLGAVLLPKLTCPVCWPAYAGLLSSVGLGFFDYTQYLLPLTAVFLGVSLFSLAYKARHRRGLGPFFLGAAAGVLMLAGKFLLDGDASMYVGLAVLIAASIWNSWPRSATSKTAPTPDCLTCVGGVESSG